MLKRAKIKKTKAADAVVSKYSFFPTESIRPSPFCILGPREKQDFAQNQLVVDGPWGKLSLSGWKLSIYDETVMLTLLWLYKHHGKDSFLTTQYELCKIMQVTACRDSYNALWKSLCRLTETSFRLESCKGKGQNRHQIPRTVANMLTGAAVDEISGKLLITLNPYFRRMFAGGLITSINLQLWLSIHGDIAKALYIFFQSQRPFHKDGKFHIGLIKLRQAINWGQTANIPKSEMRRKIKTALNELKAKDFLKDWSIDPKTDVVHVTKLKKERKKSLFDKDKHPGVTAEIKKRWMRYNPIIVEKDELRFIEAAEKLVQFWNEHRKYMLSYDDSHCPVHQQVQYLFEAIDDDRGNYEPTIGWLCSDKTYKERLPRYLEKMGLIESERSFEDTYREDNSDPEYRSTPYLLPPAIDYHEALSGNNSKDKGADHWTPGDG